MIVLMPIASFGFRQSAAPERKGSGASLSGRPAGCPADWNVRLQQSCLAV